MKTAICCGYLCCDLLVSTAEYPHENQKQFIDSMQISSGGPAANAACLLARWGVRTYFIGQLGDDHFTDIVIRDLEAAGVHTDYLQIYDGPCNCAVVISSHTTGSRTVFSKNHSRNFPIKMSVNTPTADGILVDGHQYNESVRLLENHTGISVLDAGSFRQETADLLAAVTDPVASSAFFLSLQEHNGKQTDSRNRFPEFLVITDGENPVTILSANERSTVPVFDVTALDTLAAGDCFHGAYLFGRLYGLKEAECITLAAAASAICVTRPGGYKSLPSLDETLLFLSRSHTGMFSTGQLAALSDRLWAAI